MDGLTPGRIVHFVMPDGQHRPAIVVQLWGNDERGYVNLHVFTDTGNDARSNDDHEFLEPVVPKYTVGYSEGKEPGTWHWIEKA